MTKTEEPLDLVEKPFTLGDYEVDPKALRIRHKDRSVKVELKVMQVLLVLADDAGEMVSRRTLESTVWAGRIVTEDAVTNAVAKLRRAFGDDARSPSYIETVPKLGYRLMCKPQRPTRKDAHKSPSNTRWQIYIAGILTAAFIVAAILVWRPTGHESGVPERGSDTVAASIAMPGPSSGEVAGARNGAELTSQQGTRNTLAAFDEFSLGLAAYLRMTPDDNDLARTHYLRAIELDSNFARAYAGTALTWIREVMDGWTNDAEQSIREASHYVAMAETIDPDVSQVYFVKGMVALFQGRHLAAAEAAHHATRLDPNYADAYALLAWTLHHGGRPDAATDALHEALRLNPESSASFEVIAGEINFSTGRYDEAIASFRNALERNPTHARARLWLTASLAQIDELNDARWELDELMSQNPDFSFEHTAFGLPQKDPEVLSRFFRSLGRTRRLD